MLDGIERLESPSVGRDVGPRLAWPKQARTAVIQRKSLEHKPKVGFLSSYLLDTTLLLI